VFGQFSALSYQQIFVKKKFLKVSKIKIKTNKRRAYYFQYKIVIKIIKKLRFVDNNYYIYKLKK